MKVLFAVNNDKISDAVIKRYQKDYKEILSYKNVYYFNAIVKELQKDKSYDRVVISEDLEPFANNNYDAIDKFLFDRLDAISDETTDSQGNDIEIVLICNDRRSKSDEMLVKYFGIGIYSALIEQDRKIEEVCKLLHKPRSKREAKIYYKVEAENVNYQAEDENNVSEAEVQNILAHYKRLGKDEDKYVDSFNNIVSQYNDNQLRIIISCLPIGVRAVLEQKSQKYQELMMYTSRNTNEANRILTNMNEGKASKQQKPPINIKMLNEDKKQISKPIVIPSGLNKQGVKKLIKETPKTFNVQQNKNENDEAELEEPNDSLLELDNLLEEIEDTNIKKDVTINTMEQEKPIKRGRGRPKKVVPVELEQVDKPKRGRGRPRKNSLIEKQDEEIDLFNLDTEEKIETKQNNSNETEEIDLFDLDSEEEIETKQDNSSEIEEIDLFDLEEKKQEEVENIETNLVSAKNVEINSEYSALLSKDKKVVAFVGTTKNGTSFVVNNLAELLASMGIKTAVLDLTQSKNAFYIYTNNEENLRKQAEESIGKLRNGIADGIKVNKNLAIYTALPTEKVNYDNAEEILSTLVKNYSVVLIDCDFDTPIDYFEKSQEIYLVQSMDVLTIQPLTAFLRNLKAKGILRQEKIKVVINKFEKVKSLSAKVLIGGIAFYNDPGMSYMTELFNKDTAPYCIIPFEIQNYVKYLETLATCNISLNGYTKSLISSLKDLANLVYPLINKQTYYPRGEAYKDNFSTEMYNTLNKMKKYQ